jgi:uncharacterized protein
VTRRLQVAWPAAAPFESRDGRPIRLLALSDEVDPTLDHARNRDALGPLDGIVGCGDLEPEWLGFLGDALSVPIVRVTGNHDREDVAAADLVPRPLAAARDGRLPIDVVGLSWPGRPPLRGDLAAWGQAVRVLPRSIPRGPVLVASHVPPEGVGDGTDPYHRGFAAYRWLLHRLRPPLWLHGHTTMAATTGWRVQEGRTLVVNVTGSVLVEICPPGARERRG